MIGQTIRATRASVARDMASLDREIEKTTAKLRALMTERVTAELLGRVASVVDVESDSEPTVPVIVDAGVEPPAKGIVA